MQQFKKKIHTIIIVTVKQKRNLGLNSCSISSPIRSPDEGEREPEACGGGQDGPGTVGRHQRALQHHLLCHAGGDPALPPDPCARLQGPDAILPTAADFLLSKNHRQARGGPAEIRQRVTDPLSQPVGLDLGDQWPCTTL